MFTSSIFCNREKLSRPLKKIKKLAGFFVLKAQIAFFLLPSNEPILDPTLLAYYVSRLEPIRHVADRDMALSRVICPPLFLVLTVESFLPFLPFLPFRDEVSMFRLGSVAKKTPDLIFQALTSLKLKKIVP